MDSVRANVFQEVLLPVNVCHVIIELHPAQSRANFNVGLPVSCEVDGMASVAENTYTGGLIVFALNTNKDLATQIAR